MKKLYLFAALATMLAACSENDLTAEKQVVQQNAEEEAVVFDAYVLRGTTRAGKDGVLTTSTASGHQISLGTEGFGVFGYYTDGEPYAGNTKPNFFYNQKVYFDSRWAYSPLKYWPNEFGNDAVSAEVDRVSLFAYAPYVEVDGLTGLVVDDATTDYKNTNIVSMTRNTANGDPFVKYVASMDATNSVDLCYGVAAEAFTSSNSIYNRNTTIGKGDPYVDVVKPATDEGSKINFDFKHALAQLVVTLDANVSDLTTPGSNVHANTRIWVRSITFSGITQKGTLNLHDGKWYDVNGVNQITTGSLTVYDGQKDGREANDKAPSESPTTLNPRFVQSTPYTVDAPSTYVLTAPLAADYGVSATPYNLFKNTDNNDPVFAIPTNEVMEVTIVYDVETADKNLSSVLSDGVTRGSTIENTISKKLTALGDIVPGKCYRLALHLGMRTVDFEASVTDWVNYTVPVDLPANAPMYAAATTADYALGSIDVPYNAKTFSFIVSNFAADEDITKDKTGNVTTVNVTNGSGTDDKSSTTGLVYVTATLNSNAPNNTTTKKPGTAKVAGTSYNGILTINQLAHPLNLAFVSYTAGTKKIAVSVSSDLENYNTSSLSTATVTVDDLTTSTTNLAKTVGTIAPEIEMTDALSPGHTYKVTVVSGDVTESITFVP